MDRCWQVGIGEECLGCWGIWVGLGKGVCRGFFEYSSGVNWRVVGWFFVEGGWVILEWWL